MISKFAFPKVIFREGAVALALTLLASPLLAADDKPALKVGFTLFADYTYTNSPTAKNADGSDYNPNAFNVSRAYLNVTGQLHHLLAFRITTDLVRVTDASGNFSISTIEARTNRRSSGAPEEMATGGRCTGTGSQGI